MISSMTGYGRAAATINNVGHTIEIKTLNSKFCEVKTRLPPDYMPLDFNLQTHLKERFSRGRVEVYVSRDEDLLPGASVRFNRDLAEQYYKALLQLKAEFGFSQDVSLSMISQAKEVLVVARHDLDFENIWKELKNAADKAVSAVREMRMQEGRHIAMDMAGRINRVKEWTYQIEQRAPKELETYRKRLTERLQAFINKEIDDQRILMEAALFADRSDITEELVRIRSHLQKFLHSMEEEQPTGRILDFLCQELMREANTIASKANSAETSQTVVLIKAELEKLREQVQNVE